MSENKESQSGFSMDMVRKEKERKDNDKPLFEADELTNVLGDDEKTESQPIASEKNEEEKSPEMQIEEDHKMFKQLENFNTI